MSEHVQNRIIAGFLLASVAFALGFLAGGRGETHATWLLSGAENKPANIDLAPVWKAWRLLDEKFVPATTTEPLSEQDRVWGIVSGLAQSYGDPYTVFMPPAQTQDFQEEISGEFGGLGVEIGMRAGMLTVIAPLKGTPADAAGLRPGDIIAEIDHVATYDKTIDDAVRAIRGEVGTEVVLTIAREGENELLEVPILRDTIEIPTIDVTSPGRSVTVVALYNFGATATTQFRSALRDFVESGNTKLIIDLRGNPGGYLDAAVDVASWFLPLGKVVVTEDYGDNTTPTVHRSKGYDIKKDNWTIAVLVDEGSASASEIVAGALQEQGVAKLIGKRTFGKGSVQELIDITPDTALKITVARWLTPNGTSISDGGLTPDLEVQLTGDDIEAERDPQLDAAVQYVQTGELVAPATTTSQTVNP